MPRYYERIIIVLHGKVIKKFGNTKKAIEFRNNYYPKATIYECIFT